MLCTIYTIICGTCINRNTGQILLVYHILIYNSCRRNVNTRSFEHTVEHLTHNFATMLFGGITDFKSTFSFKVHILLYVFLICYLDMFEQEMC